MKTYTSPEVIEIGVADEVILGIKPGPFWDELENGFAMSGLSVVDNDE